MITEAEGSRNKHTIILTRENHEQCDRMRNEMCNKGMEKIRSALTQMHRCYAMSSYFDNKLIIRAISLSKTFKQQPFIN